MQALLANNASSASGVDKEDDDNNNNIPRPVVIREVIKTKASKPFIWSLLALVHSVARRAPGFLATSPSTLKFIGLCDSFGVSSEKWSSDISLTPFSIDSSTTWQPPALSPNSLIRQIEEKAWYEYLSARVESLFNAKEIQKFCHRVTQQRKSPAFSSGKNKNNNNAEDDEQQQEQEDGLINVLIPPTKLALLASKFSSKLLRNKSLFFPSQDDENEKNANIQTVTFCIDCLDFLTHSQKELTTLKKVAHACKMMLGVLGVASIDEETEEEKPEKEEGDSSSDDDDDSNNKEQEEKPARIVPEELKSLVEQIDSVSLRCQGGASEDEVALASARQLMAVAKFKAAETANGISRIIDEIVAEDDDDEDEEKKTMKASSVKERVTIQGDDVLSAMSVAVNTLLGPPKRIVQFSEEMMMLNEDAAANNNNNKKGKKDKNNNKKEKKTHQDKNIVVRKTREEEEMDAELEAEMRGATATTSNTDADVAADAATSAKEEVDSTEVDKKDNDNDDDEEEKEQEQPKETKKTEKNEEEEDDENTQLQKRVMHLLEYEVSQGRTLPRRAQTFLDRCRQELRRRKRED